MKKIKSLYLLTVAFCFAPGAMAQEQVNYSNCLERTSTVYGTPCAQCPVDNKTMRIYLTNTCEEYLEVKLAMKDDNKRIRIFNALSLAPHDSLSGYICDGNARFYFWARKSGDKSITLPSDAEIKEYYGKRDY